MYTEDQARKLICFNTFATFLLPGKIGLSNAKTISPQNFSTNCFASKCHGWRWLDAHEKDNGNTRKGYCGLAGYPGP